MYQDWTPGIQGLDPRCTETGPLMYKATRPSIPQMRTKDFVESRTSWDSGLRGIRDFVGFRTSWDSGLHGIQDFVGFRTSWDSGLRGIWDSAGKCDPYTSDRIVFYFHGSSVHGQCPLDFTEPSSMQICDIYICALFSYVMLVQCKSFLVQ